MKRFILCMAMLLAFTGYACADGIKTTMSVSEAPEKKSDAVVAELFTSQGCSSCPPAQEFLMQLSRRPDVLTLEFHIDYWDQLKTWTGGSWKDPFSGSEWTQRQVDYNKLIMDSERAYTPEMVIDGKFQEIGSSKSSIDNLIEQAQAQKKGKFSVDPAVAADGNMKVSVDGSRLQKPAQVVLLRLLKEAATKVGGGENNGALMKSHNIVRSLMVIGTWDGGKGSYSFALPKFQPDEGCAVLLQDPETMHIYAGGLCSL